MEKMKEMAEEQQATRPMLSNDLVMTICMLVVSSLIVLALEGDH